MKEAPKTVTIKSNNPTLLKAFWEDIEKLGYKLVGIRKNDELRSIGHNKPGDVIKSKDHWSEIFAPDSENRDIIYTLPAEYQRAYDYMKDAMEYWEKNEPEHQVGDWVTLVMNDCNNGDGHGEGNVGMYRIGDTFKITAIVKSDSEKVGYWFRNKKGWSVSENIVRKATPEEIQKAAIKIVKIGHKGTDVTITPGNIKAENYLISPEQIRETIVLMLASHVPPIGHWAVKLSQRTATIGCCENVTVQELQAVINAYNELTD